MYKFNSKIFLQYVESGRKKKSDIYVDFALEEANQHNHGILRFDNTNKKRSFSKLDKRFKYNLIFSVKEDFLVKKNTKQKEFGKYMRTYYKPKQRPFYMELGLFTLNLKKKYYFVTVHLIANNIGEFFFDNDLKLNKKPDYNKLLEIINSNSKWLWSLKFEDDYNEFPEYGENATLEGFCGKEITFSKEFFNKKKVDDMFLKHKFFRPNIKINFK